MFPNLDMERVGQFLEEEEEFIYNNSTFLYDFEKGDFVYKDGNPVRVTGAKALHVWLEKAIRTRIYNYLIYDNTSDDGYLKYREYGSNIIDLVRGRKLPNLVVKAEAQRDIEELIVRNPYIRRIENFDIETNTVINNGMATISFDVITVFTEYGEDRFKFIMEV